VSTTSMHTWSQMVMPMVNRTVVDVLLKIKPSLHGAFLQVVDVMNRCFIHHTTTILWPFFRDHPGEPVKEDNFCTIWRKGRLTEADTQTIRLGATPSGLTSATSTIPHFLQAGCPSCRPPAVSKHWRQSVQLKHITGIWFHCFNTKQQ